MSLFRVCFMHKSSFRQVFACVAAIALVGSIAFIIAKSRANSHSSKGVASHAEPHLILWAWERPTDLRFINPNEVGVAFLAKTINLESDGVSVRPRLQSLNIPDATSVIAVARIEIDRHHQPALSIDQRERTAREIAEISLLPNVSEVQIDFDATKSEREFYREVIEDVRHRLPANTRLSITALASWCMDDDWISDLPIDEAVPMLFRMAGDGKQIVNRLNAGEDFQAPLCRQSYGVSLDEQRPNTTQARKLYVFNPDAWTEKSVMESSK